jgi:putative effector of murein hydrolase LrgA (UPF0299 family)
VRPGLGSQAWWTVAVCVPTSVLVTLGYAAVSRGTLPSVPELALTLAIALAVSLALCVGSRLLPPRPLAASTCAFVGAFLLMFVPSMISSLASGHPASSWIWAIVGSAVFAVPPTVSVGGGLLLSQRRNEGSAAA